jgi:hypothetical protein
VHLIELASIKNVLIHALELVVKMQIVKLSTIIQFVVVLQDKLEIHLFLVNMLPTNQFTLKIEMIIHVNHHHVELIQYVKFVKIVQYVHVLKILLENHLIVDQNVF